MNLCAVKNCPNPGRPQICFYDGKYHHHGCIHYDIRRHHPTQLEFRDDGWYFICDEHYAILKAEWETWQKSEH